MFEIFFPISEIYFNPILILSTGLIGGFIAGFLGIGCGIIITPFLMELGVPPLIAVATQIMHAVGTNTTNFLTYKRKQDVDFGLAFYMLLGGAMGAFVEWCSIKYFPGQSALFNKFAYIYIITLIVIGITMFFQGTKNIFSKQKIIFHQSFSMRRWMLYLPFHAIFRRSRAEMSILVPIFVGMITGMIVASLGGGNSLFMAPILTYLIGRISPVVQGTTALTGAVITAIIALVYSERGYYCDILFAVILFMGGSAGSWIGVRLSYKIPRNKINVIASIVVFSMASRLAFRLWKGNAQNAIIDQSSTLEQKSIFFQIANDNPMVYTLSCICFISIFAFVSERFFHHTLKRKKAKRRKR